MATPKEQAVEAAISITKKYATKQGIQYTAQDEADYRNDFAATYDARPESLQAYTSVLTDFYTKHEKDAAADFGKAFATQSNQDALTTAIVPESLNFLQQAAVGMPMMNVQKRTAKLSAASGISVGTQATKTQPSTTETGAGAKTTTGTSTTNGTSDQSTSTATTTAPESADDASKHAMEAIEKLMDMDKLPAPLKLFVPQILKSLHESDPTLLPDLTQQLTQLSEQRKGKKFDGFMEAGFALAPIFADLYDKHAKKKEGDTPQDHKKKSMLEKMLELLFKALVSLVAFLINPTLGLMVASSMLNVEQPKDGSDSDKMMSMFQTAFGNAMKEEPTASVIQASANKNPSPVPANPLGPQGPYNVMNPPAPHTSGPWKDRAIKQEDLGGESSVAKATTHDLKSAVPPTLADKMIEGGGKVDYSKMTKAPKIQTIIQPQPSPYPTAVGDG